MSDNVTSIDGRPVGVPSSKPSPYLVEALEELLERAKNGQAVGAAIVVMESDGMCPHQLVGRVGGFTMAGSVSAMLFRINALNSSEE